MSTWYALQQRKSQMVSQGGEGAHGTNLEERSTEEPGGSPDPPTTPKRQILTLKDQSPSTPKF